MNNCRGGPPWPPDWQNRMLGSRYGWPRRATPTVVWIVSDVSEVKTVQINSFPHIYTLTANLLL